MNGDLTWQLRCAVVMPDHVHVLAILGDRLPIGKCIARLKSKTKSSLNAASANLEWERDFYDHRVRPKEDRVAIFRYIFQNPHRAGLCEYADRWPWYYCREEDWQWFKDHIDVERPYPSWLL
jgi:putative transposase